MTFFVTGAGPGKGADLGGLVRRSGVKRAKCVHNIAECDWPSSFL
jgi:hypothetical protein